MSCQHSSHDVETISPGQMLTKAAASANTDQKLMSLIYKAAVEKTTETVPIPDGHRYHTIRIPIDYLPIQTHNAYTNLQVDDKI